jgi:DNA-binding PadR family transcriptional regulator
MTPARRPDPASFLPLTPVAFEILLALAEADRHGYDIMLEIERRTAGRVSLNPGTLYRALDRLVEQGLLASSFQAIEPARAGAGDRRRLFAISELGEAVAAAEAARLDDQVRAARSVKLFRKGGA